VRRVYLVAHRQAQWGSAAAAVVLVMAAVNRVALERQGVPEPVMAAWLPAVCQGQQWEDTQCPAA
jgi:hypothetical protein